MSTRLESGLYFIFRVDWTSGKPVERPLGITRRPGLPPLVVVLPEGVAAPKWRFEALPADNYIISLEEATAPVNGTVRLANLVPPFEWLVFRSAPHPPPVGNDAYAITTRDHQAWSAERVDLKEEEIPIVISHIADSWHLVRADRKD